jgi:hypothetical protein
MRSAFAELITRIELLGRNGPHFSGQSRPANVAQRSFWPGSPPMWTEVFVDPMVDTLGRLEPGAVKQILAAISFAAALNASLCLIAIGCASPGPTASPADGERAGGGDIQSTAPRPRRRARGRTRRAGRGCSARSSSRIRRAVIRCCCRAAMWRTMRRSSMARVDWSVTGRTSV